MIANSCGISGTGNGRTESKAIHDLHASLKGQLILKESDTYDAARKVFFRNAITDKSPSLIAKCAQQEDVVQCIDFARDQNLLLAIRGGGHSFLGWGTCDDGLVIDMSPMKEITVDPENQTVRAGAGVLAQELIAATTRYDLAPVLGQCPSVGIAGLTLGGGLGWLSGKYGATCDNLLSAQIVTAEGRIMNCDSENNSDLFWAIRGGGGNFGVVTSFTYNLHPIGEVIAGRLTFNFKEGEKVFKNFADIMANAPDDLQATASVAKGEEEVLVSIRLCWSGDLDSGDKIIRRFQALGNPIVDNVQRQPYKDTLSMYGSGDSSGFSAVKGVYLQSLTDEAIEAVLECIKQAPGPGVAIGLDHYMHGAVCRVPSNLTAFELRSPDAVHVWVSSRWEDPSKEPQLLRWIDKTWNTLQNYSGGRVYANYPAAEGDSVTRAVYNQGYERLVKIKNRYDPNNMFRKNYNIKPHA